jgi:hypothetical protein
VDFAVHRSLLYFFLLLTVAIVGVAQASRPVHPAKFPQLGVAPTDGGFQMEGYWVWCGSVIQAEDGTYHLFASRWPKTVPFHPGWMTHSEIVRATATSPAGPYVFQDVVLPARGAEYWDGRSTHNPAITKCGDTYVLFYMGSTHPLASPAPGEPFPLTDPRAIVARANKRIGVATAKDLQGPWLRSDHPVLDTKPDTFYSFLTSNPAPVVHEDGSVLMIFKSRRYEGATHSRMMLGLARAPHYLGPYQVVGDGPLFGPDRVGELEDPFVWQTDAGYAMVAKDMTGAIVGERHAGVLAVSADGEHWELAEEPKAWSRTLSFADGSRRTLGQLERPFILFERGRPIFLFAAAGDGPGGFANMTTSFNLAIPLEP